MQSTMIRRSSVVPQRCWADEDLDAGDADAPSADVAVARGLGWVSIGIGLAEVFAPRQVERLLGIDEGQHHGLLRVLGVREIMQGVDILAHDDPTPGVWARVAGDMLDGLLLGAAATTTRRPAGLAAAAALILPIVVLDLVYAQRLAGD